MIDIKETKEIVDFGLFYSAKEYYDAAELLKVNNYTSTPYSILLSFSIECFLKSIRTTITWDGARASKVKHKKGHGLTELFTEIEKDHPDDASYLMSKYASIYGRPLKEDINLNSEVFFKKRYPYLKDGTIPSLGILNINPLSPEYDNSIAIHLTQLENVASFLHDELIVYFKGCFENAS